MAEDNVKSVEHSINDDFEDLKKNIPMTHTNPLKLIDTGSLLEPSAAPEEETLSFFAALNLPENARTKAILIQTTVAMVTLPILAFFLSYFFLFTPAEYGGDLYFHDSLTYSGVVAVLTVNVIMGFFVFYSIRMDPERDSGYENNDENAKLYAARQAKDKAKTQQTKEKVLDEENGEEPTIRARTAKKSASSKNSEDGTKKTKKAKAKKSD